MSETTLAVWVPHPWGKTVIEAEGWDETSIDASEEGEIVGKAAGAAGPAADGAMLAKSTSVRMVANFATENSLLGDHSAVMGRGADRECLAKLDRTVKCECSTCLGESERLDRQAEDLRRLIEVFRGQEEGEA